MGTQTVLLAQGFYKGNTMLWLPKKNQLGKISNGKTHHAVDQTESLRLNTPKNSQIEKEYPSTLTIRQRAYNLQQLLFGKSSLNKTNRISPEEIVVPHDNDDEEQGSSPIRDE